MMVSFTSRISVMLEALIAFPKTPRAMGGNVRISKGVSPTSPVSSEERDSELV
jgi:hypothetical protein